MSPLLTLALALAPAQAPDASAPLRGTWKVVAAFEDGRGLTEREILADVSADGQFTVDGPLISLVPPGGVAPRKLAFTVASRPGQASTIELVGAQKVGSKGIYMATGDSLMLCLAAPGDTAPPADFTAPKGSGRVLLVMKKATPPPPPAPAATIAPFTPAPAQVARAAPPLDMRSRLVGTWGYQTDDAIVHNTLNADGTFSMTRTWKGKMKALFHDDLRLSGTWKLEDGVMVAAITASTDAHLRGQVYSYRITHLDDIALTVVDQDGRPRYEWKVR